MLRESIRFEETTVPEYGESVHEKRLPSEPDLVPAVVFRMVEFLAGEGLVPEDRKNRISLCLDEAIKNAVLHGNGGDADLAVEVRIERCPDCFWVVVRDEGAGFDLDDVPDPLDDSGVWREDGRGIHLMQHFARAVEFWDGGRSVALCFPRADVAGRDSR